MDDTTHNADDRKVQARKSPAGRNLTDSQFEETLAICGIIGREIQKSGTFREKLSDYAHAFARSERFDTLKAEIIIRDVYQAYFGETMNQTREGLLAREAEIENTHSGKALDRARFVIELIGTEPTMPFYQAYDRAAVAFATSQGITERGAKEMMKTAFAGSEGRELYEAGKEAEELYHKPTQQRAESQDKSESQPRRQRNRTRS